MMKVSSCKFLAILFCGLILSSPSPAQFILDIPTTAVAGSGRFVYIISHGRVLISDNDGQTYASAQMAAGDGFFRSIASDPTDAQTVWAAADLDQGGVFRSTDAGKAWTVINAGLPSLGQPRGLFTAVGRAGLVYLRIDEEIYKSTDGGNTWTLQSTLPGLKGQSGTAFHINVADPTVWYYVAPVQPGLGIFATVLRSRDEGATWQTGANLQAAPMPDPSQNNRPYAIASSPLNPNDVWTGLYGPWTGLDGLFHSTDGGATFENLRPTGPTGHLVDLGGVVFYTEAITPTTTVPSAYFRSANGGTAFTRLQVSLTQRSTPQFSLDLSQPGVMFAALGNGPYRSTDGGLTWTRLQGEMQGTLVLPDAIEVTVPEGDFTIPYRLALRFLENPEWEADFTASISAAPWVKLEETTGRIPTAIPLTFSSAGLTQGTYEATLTLRCDFECAGSPLEVPVRLRVVDQASIVNPIYRISTIAGNTGETEYRDGVPATETAVGPNYLAVDGQDRVFVTDDDFFRIHRVDPDGSIRTVAGTGVDATSDDSAPATESTIDPGEIVIDPAGGFWFIDENGFHIRHVDADGDLTTIDGFRFADAIAADAQGNLYVIDNRIRRLNTDGSIQTLPNDGADLSDVVGAAVGPDGSVYISTFGNIIYRVFPDGNFQAYGAEGADGSDLDGVPATLARIAYPRGFDVDANGSLFFGDARRDQIRVIDPAGIIYTVELAQEPSAARLAEVPIDFPFDVKLGPNGDIYVADRGNNLVRKLSPIRPVISEGGVVNGASGLPSYSPGTLISVYGDFGDVVAASPEGLPWPTTLSGVRVTLNGRPMPISFAGPNQINVQVPYETELGAAVLVVTVNGVAGLPVTIHIDPASPGILQFGANRAVAVNVAGTFNPNEVNTAATPVAPGGYVVVYLLGMGIPDSPIATGEVAAASPLIRPATQPVTVMLGDGTVPFEFLGLTPGFIGLVQLNLPIPADLAPGDYPIKVTIGDQSSNTPVISIGP